MDDLFLQRAIEPLGDAVGLGLGDEGVGRLDAQWIVEKNGYLSPAQARQAWHAAISIRPAA